MNPSRKTRLFTVGFSLGCILAGLAIFYRFSLGPPESVGPAPLTWRTVEVDLDHPPFSLYPDAATLGKVMRQGQASTPDGQTSHTAWLIRTPSDDAWLRLEYNHQKEHFLLFYGDRLQVEANPAIDPRMIRDGFAHTGHRILTGDEEAAIYIVSVAPLPWETLPAAREFLASRRPYLLSASHVPLDDSTE